MLEIARQSIGHGLDTGNTLSINSVNFPQRLEQQRATFVTLEIDNELRGCIGTLTAFQPLIKDIAQHAFAAAFEDPRFPPLQRAELDIINISISILSQPQPIDCPSEQSLIDQLEPGVDGLILSEGFRRGTFLPSVWESLPEPAEFVSHLKRKAGLSVDRWGPGISCEKYATFSFSENQN